MRQGTYSRERRAADVDDKGRNIFSSGAVSGDFMATWRVACGIADMVAVIYSPEYKSAALEELDQLLKEV